MHLPRAWDVDVGVASPVRVAVLDSGVDRMHPDLIGRVEPGIDTVDGDSDASDEHFHGTAVASVIAADTDNKIGMAGVSWGAQIVPVRVLGSDGAGTECTIAAGIVWAAGHAQILNMSLGAANGCSAVMHQAVDYAVRQGALLVAAAGNSARQGNAPQEPSDCPGVVAVGATDRHDRAAAFSEHGPQVTLAAPGVRILAAYRAPHGVETWAFLDGTSMSTPLVSGVAALLLSRHPSWSASQVEQRMLSTAVDLGRHGRDDYFGAGLVDAARAMRG
jgi:subtilisin family serine protease